LQTKKAFRTWDVFQLCMKLQKMSKHSRQPKCKQLKMEPADEDFEQQRDEMDITSNAADGENSQGNNAAVSQSTVLDEDEQLGCEEVEDNESKCFAEASSQIRGKSSSTKTGKVETRNRGSSVWKYFVRLHKAAICKICRKSLKRSVGSTTNLLQHLKRAHSKEYAAAVVESSHRKMEEATRRMVRCILYNEHCVLTSVQNIWPFNAVAECL